MSNFRTIKTEGIEALIDQPSEVWLSEVGSERLRSRGANITKDTFFKIWKHAHVEMPLRSELEFKGEKYFPHDFSNQILENFCLAFRAFENIEESSDEWVQDVLGNFRFPQNVYDYLKSSWDSGSFDKIPEFSCETLKKQVLTNKTDRGGRLSKYISSSV